MRYFAGRDGWRRIPGNKKPAEAGSRGCAAGGWLGGNYMERLIMGFLNFVAARRLSPVFLHRLDGLISDDLRLAQEADDGTVFCKAQVLSDGTPSGKAFINFVDNHVQVVRELRVKLKKLGKALDFADTGTAVCFGTDSDNNVYAFFIRRGLVDVVCDLRDPEHFLTPVGEIELIK